MVSMRNRFNNQYNGYNNQFDQNSQYNGYNNQFNQNPQGFNYEGFNNYVNGGTTNQVQYNSVSHGLTLGEYTKKVYGWMFIGLAITFGIGMFLVANKAQVISLLYEYDSLYYILAGVEVILVFALNFFIQKLSPAVAAGIFLLYSAVNGLTFAPLLIMFDISTAFTAFAVTGCIFGLMAAFATFTKKDLSSWGSVLVFGLIGLMVYSVIALLFNMPQNDFFISIVGIILFMGFTAYDTQKIKAYYNSGVYSAETAQKGAIIAALQLYLDYINLFLYILRLFANRRD